MSKKFTKVRYDIERQLEYFSKIRTGVSYVASGSTFFVKVLGIMLKVKIEEPILNDDIITCYIWCDDIFLAASTMWKSEATANLIAGDFWSLISGVCSGIMIAKYKEKRK